MTADERATQAEADRDEWKRQHENLLDMYQHAISDLHNLRRMNANSMQERDEARRLHDEHDSRDIGLGLCKPPWRKP